MKKICKCLILILFIFLGVNSIEALTFETGSFFNGKIYDNQDFYDNIEEEKRIQIKFKEYMVKSSLKESVIKLKQEDVLRLNFHNYDSLKYINMSKSKIQDVNDIDKGFYLIVEEIYSKKRPVYIVHVINNEVAEVGEFIYDESLLKYINFINLRPKAQWSFGINISKMEYQLCVVNNSINKTDTITYIYSGGVPVCYYTSENNNINNISKIKFYNIEDVLKNTPIYEIDLVNNIPENAKIFTINQTNIYEVERDYTYWPGFGEMMNIYSNIKRIFSKNNDDKINIFVVGFHEKNYNENIFDLYPKNSVLKINDRKIVEIITDDKYIIKYGWFPDLNINGEFFSFKRERISDDGLKYKYKYVTIIKGNRTEKIVEYNYDGISNISTEHYNGKDRELFNFFRELDQYNRTARIKAKSN